MNIQNFQDLSAEDRAFAIRAQAQLRATETLNYTESARLAAARAQACAMLQTPPTLQLRWAWLAAPAAFAVAVAVIQLAPRTQSVPAGNAVQPVAHVNAPSGNALELLSDETGPDFYRDLAFYEWLERQSRSEPHA